jgi:hypothetical protein
VGVGEWKRARFEDGAGEEDEQEKEEREDTAKRK